MPVSSDTFDRADADVLGTDKQSNSWVTSPGASVFGIRDNRALLLPSGAGSKTCLAELDGLFLANVAVAVNLGIGPINRVRGVFARRSGDSYYWAISTQDKLVLRARRDGQDPSPLATYTLPARASGRIGLRAQGDLIELLWNGKVVIQFVDPTPLASGTFGLYGAISDLDTSWDNWNVDDIGPALLPTSKAQTIYLRFESDAPGSKLAFSIDQPGTVDIADAIAEPISANVWRGQYEVQKFFPLQYVDGIARVRVKVDGTEQAVLPFLTSDYLAADCGGPHFRIDTTPPSVIESSLSVTRITGRPFSIDFRFNDVLDSGMGAVVGLVNSSDQYILLPETVTFRSPYLVRAEFVPPTPNWELAAGIYRICISEVFDCPGNEMIGSWCRSVVVDTSPPKVIQFEVDPRVISAVAGCNKTRISFRTDEPALDTMVVLVGGHLATRVFMAADRQFWVWEYTATGTETEGPADVAISLSDEDGHAGTEIRKAAVVFDFTPPTITFIKPPPE